VPSSWHGSLNGSNISAAVLAAPSGDPEGCGSHDAGTLQNRILLVSRGTCYFSHKALRAQEAGAVGLIVYDNAEVTTIAVMSGARRRASLARQAVRRGGGPGDDELGAGLDLDRTSFCASGR